MAGQRVEQQPLREAVDRRSGGSGARGLPSASGAASSTTRSQGRRDPVDAAARALLPALSGGPSAHANDAAPPLGLVDPVLAADDQRAEQVDAVVQVVVLGIDVDAHQVRVLG